MRWLNPVIAGVMLALSAGGAAGEEAGITVRDAWVREAPPGAAMMAGYMALRNNSSRAQILVGARSADFAAVMIHRTTIKNDMAGMQHTPQIELAPNENLLFAPGGYHLMLMNPKRPMRAGDRVGISLEFRGGLVLPVAFAVRK